MTHSTDRKIGWLCSYVPEEIILAAGFQGVRLQGHGGTTRLANAAITGNVCWYLRHLLEAGLRKEYAGVQGIIFSDCCDGMRRLHDLWGAIVETPFTFMLNIPRNRDARGVRFFHSQLMGLVSALENAFGVSITRDKLEEAMRLLDRRRSVMLSHLGAQKEIPPPCRGPELIKLCLQDVASSQQDQTTEGRKDTVRRRSGTDRCQIRSPRILIAGNAGNKINLFALVEASGGAAVSFDNCYGFVHYEGHIDAEGDPVERLARRYLGKPPCYRMPGSKVRMERLSRLCEAFAIEGLIYSVMQFCDYGYFEVPEIQRTFKGRLPLLVLEHDYILSDEAALRTRIEAFTEMIRESH